VRAVRTQTDRRVRVSLFKQIWIDRDPAAAKVRTDGLAEFNEYAKDFVHRLPSIRFESGRNGKKRRSPWWSYAVGRALEDSPTEFVRINGGIFFRNKGERDRIRDLADHYMSRGVGMLRRELTPRTREEYLASRFQASLRGRYTTAEKAKQQARLAHTDCPNCGHPMKVRIARKGFRAGTRFMGCSRYPSCQGTRALPNSSDRPD
jgi:hypothetical protein